MAKRKTKRRRRRSTAMTTKRRRRSPRKNNKLPMPQLDHGLYVGVAILAGRAVKTYVDIPWVSEEALGIYVLAVFTKNNETAKAYASVALGLELVQIADESGVSDQLLSFIE